MTTNRELQTLLELLISKNVVKYKDSNIEVEFSLDASPMQIMELDDEKGYKKEEHPTEWDIHKSLSSL